MSANIAAIRREWSRTGSPGMSTLEARGMVAEDHLLVLCDEIERLRPALEEAHRLADEAVHGKAIRFSVCSRISRLTREALDG